MIISTKVICKQPDRYIGWPTVIKTTAGELVAVFSGDRDAHVCPYGKSQMIRSRDSGKTWTEPVTINNTPLDDRDTGIVQTRSGTLLVSWFTSVAFKEQRYRGDGWDGHLGKITPQTVAEWLGIWVRRSEDGGQTWQPPIKTHACTPHGPIQLADGRLLCIGRPPPIMADGKMKWERKLNIIEVSEDDGRTWKTIAGIPMPPGDGTGYLVEPHVVEASPGRLVAMFRHNTESGACEKSVLWQAESGDGGYTWTTPYPTAIWGEPPHLTKLRDGRLLVTYGHRRAPYGERACLSYDGGKTWDYEHEIVLVDDNLCNDLGYPASVELDDGSIFTVYYQIDKPDEITTCLMATHWTLPSVVAADRTVRDVLKTATKRSAAADHKVQAVEGWSEKRSEDYIARNKYQDVVAARCFAIDISAACNMGFVDDGHGKRCVFDHGEKNDLREFPTGDVTLSNVPFRIVDPAKNNGASMIVLRGHRQDYFPLEVNGIPVGRNAKYLYFLHTIAYEGGKFSYIVNYEDGTVREVEIKGGESVGGWWNPSEFKAPKAKVAWEGGNSKCEHIGVYCYRWENPELRKKIQTLAIRSQNLYIIPGILAITGEAE